MKSRFATVLLAAALAVGVIGVGPAEAACTHEEIIVNVWTVGVVRDVFGQGIAGALVESNDSSTTTGNDGRYTIRSRSDCPLKFTASHDLYETQTIVITNPAQAAVVDFTLPFKLIMSMTPTAFKTLPTTISISTLTTAPRTGSHVIAQTGATTIELVYAPPQPGDPPNRDRYVGSYVVPAGTPEGRYLMKACALQTSSSSCSSTLGARLSSVDSMYLYYDVTPPALDATTPARFADVLSTSSISLIWNDSLSGVDPTMGHWLNVDGTPRVSSISGAIQGTLLSGLTPGVHLVDAGVQDLAGNPVQTKFIFTLAQVSATSATATLRSRTVAVNPTSAIPPPTTVRFTQPQVDTSAFTESLNASTRVGYGDLQRAFSLGTVQVVFNNETGVPSAVQNVSVPTAAARHRVASLAPSAVQMTTTVAAASTTIGDVVVSVPAGYNTPGSTATLISKMVALGGTTPVGAASSLLEGVLPTQYEVSGRIEACREQTPSGPGAHCAADNKVGIAVAFPGEQPIQVMVPGPNWADQHLEASVPPTCDGCNNAANPAESHAGLVLGCSTYQVPGTTSAINLCDPNDSTAETSSGYLASFLNAWVYETPFGTSVRYPIWRQDHIVASAEGDRCPNGLSPSRRVTSTIATGASDNLSLITATPQLVAGMWQGAGFVKLGAWTGPSENQAEDQGIVYDRHEDRTYQVANDPTLLLLPKANGYRILKGQAVFEDGVATALPHASANAWMGTAPTTGNLQLVHGAEFSAGSVSGFAYVGTLAFKATVNFPC